MGWLLTGCGTPKAGKATTWNLEIAANTAQSVRLDVVGINELDKPDWQALAVDEYWNPDNAIRKNAQRLSFEVVDGKINLAEAKGVVDKNLTGLGTSKIQISRLHSIWKQWMGRRDVGVVVIGYFPGGSSDRPDPRKRILPLYSKYWETKNKVLRVELQDSRIQVLTPPSSKASRITF
jgi:hypothetical protein